MSFHDPSVAIDDVAPALVVVVTAIVLVAAVCVSSLPVQKDTPATPSGCPCRRAPC